MPLGIAQDWWDRTEAQVRGALHSHIVVWWLPRQCPDRSDYKPTQSIPRVVPGNEPKQQAPSQKSAIAHPYQKDAIYYNTHIAHVTAELIRPHVGELRDGTKWGGFDYEKLRIAGLARTIQSRLYIHTCGPKHCLHDAMCTAPVSQSILPYLCSVALFVSSFETLFQYLDTANV